MANGMRIAATISRAASAAAGPSFKPMTAIARPCLVASTSTSQQSRSFKMPSLPFNLWPKRSTTESDKTPVATSQDSTPLTGESTSESLFEQVANDEEIASETSSRKKHTEHRYSTANFKISHRKLNKLSRQIAGQPVDEAILQMAFSEKRASNRIKSTLALARDHAIDKGLNRERLVVAETWISKGKKVGRINIHGRARMGIKHHGSAKMYLVLREGKTRLEKQERQRKGELHKVRSAGVVREDGVLRRKTISQWAW